MNITYLSEILRHAWYYIAKGNYHQYYAYFTKVHQKNIFIEYYKNLFQLHRLNLAINVYFCITNITPTIINPTPHHRMNGTSS